jgi:nicotinamide mononucleotide adenylyltransferase
MAKRTSSFNKAASDLPQQGLIIGKFKPPHRGHDFLINHGAAHCQSLIVLVMARHDDDIPGTLRAAWLKEQHPGKDIRLVTHDLPIGVDTPESWKNWIALIRANAPKKIDIMFSSEGYAVKFANLLKARHQCVDAARIAVPVSATQVRNDYSQFKGFVSPSVRAWMEKHFFTQTPQKPTPAP